MYSNHGPFSSDNDIHLSIHKLENGTFIAKIHQPVDIFNTTRFNSTTDDYDSKGALVYVCAVIFIYGFSIILMIASLIKKSMSDHGVSKYMKDIDRVRQIARRQEKFKTRLAMQKKHGRISLASDRKHKGHTSRRLAETFFAQCESHRKNLSDKRSRSVNYALEPQCFTASEKTMAPRSKSCDADTFQIKFHSNTAYSENNTDTNLSIDTGSDIDVPEVKLDLCQRDESGALVENTRSTDDTAIDCSVVSAFILPTLPGNATVGSLYPHGSNISESPRLSISSVNQLQPLLEKDEDAIIV